MVIRSFYSECQLSRTAITEQTLMIIARRMKRASNNLIPSLSEFASPVVVKCTTSSGIYSNWIV